MIDLGLRVEDELSLLWVELDPKEGVLLAFHSSHKRSTNVIVTDSNGCEDRSQVLIGIESVWRHSVVMMIVGDALFSEDLGFSSKRSEHAGCGWIIGEIQDIIFIV